MKDPIERQDAIDALEKIPVLEFKKTDGLLDALVSIGQVYRALKQLPSAQPDSDMIHLQKEQAYMQGYEDGQGSVREFIIKETTYSDFGTGQKMVGDLIRCKDCKHYNSYFVECESESGLKHISDHHQWCCNAERREE